MNETTRESKEGVQLIKRVEKEEYDVPAVVYEFTSERKDDLTVQIVETTQETLELDHIGTHKEFKPNTWDVTDGELEFEVDLEPEGDRKIIFALRPPSSVEIEQFEGRPETLTVSPEREALVRGGVSAKAPPTATPTDTESPNRTERPTTEPSTQKNGHEPLESSGVHGESENSNGNTQSGVQESEPTGDDDRRDSHLMVEQFVAELRDGHVSEEDLHYLEQRFGTTGHASSTVDARIKQLQSDFADLRAYTSALEEFLNEDGSGREVINSIQNRLESVDSELDSLESRVSENESDLSTFRENHRKVRSDTEALSTTVDSLEDDIEELSSEVDQINDQVPSYDLDERFAEVEGDISEVKEFTSRLQGALQGGLEEDPE